MCIAPYGADHVAMVCTYATLRARYALHEVGKVYGLSESRLSNCPNNCPLLAPRAHGNTCRTRRLN